MARATFRDDLPDRSGNFPDRVNRDPREFARAQQDRQGKQLDHSDDRVFTTMAILTLVGIGGYAAVRHFPTGTVKAMAREVQDFFRSPGQFVSKSVLPKLHKALDKASEVVTQQPWAHVNKGGSVSQVLSTARAAVDPEVSQGIRIFVEAAEKNPRFFSHTLKLKGAKASHLHAPIPQDSSNLRSLSLDDLFDPSGGWREDIWGGMPEQFENIHKQLLRLGKIRGMKSGDVSAFLSSVQVDQGLYARTTQAGAHELVNLRGLHPGNWLGTLSTAANKARQEPFWDQVKSGGIFARFFDWIGGLVAPTGTMEANPAIARVGREFVQEAFPNLPAQSIREGVVMGGKLYPVFKGGGVGSAAEGAYNLVRADSTVAAGARIRLREQAQRAAEAAGGPTALHQYFQQKKIDPTSLQGRLLSALDWLGVGPQYSLRNIVRTTDAIPGVDVETIPGQIHKAMARPVDAAIEMATGMFGSQVPSPYAEKYIPLQVGQAIDDWGNYLVGRVGRLFEQTTGLGIRPGVTSLESFGRWVGLGVAGIGAVQGARYLDYKSRQVFGYGPSDLAIDAYTGIRTGFQHLLDFTGIRAGAEYLEDLMPGIINSPLSRIARGALTFGALTGRGPRALRGLTKHFNLPALGRKYLGRRGQFAGMALATTAALAQFTDPTQDPAELARIYRGEQDVAVREARWWALGTQPYTGGRILYTRPHRLAVIRSRAETIARYGSEAEYWRNNFFPTPESWFGARPLLDPYRVERQNYQTRPYPLTGGMFKDVPFVGPTLSATVGELIKPTRRMHPEAWAGDQLVEPTQTPGVPAGTAERLGFEPLARSPRQAGDPTTLAEVAGKQIDIFKDFLGMPGFLYGAAKQRLTGEDDFNVANRQIATANEITSVERSYYNMEMGGGLGMTELFRRFYPHRRRQIELVNPIPNQMPGWLPGSFSDFPEDRNAWVDLHRGDPYARIREGDIRLPGAGYEALHRLHSGVPGVYDAYDRWRILRDVAPGSDAFRHYDAIVRMWAKGGHLANTSDGKALEQAFGGRKLYGVVTAAVSGDTVTVDFRGRLANVQMPRNPVPELQAAEQFEASLPDEVRNALAQRRLSQRFVGQNVQITLSGTKGFRHDPGNLAGDIATLDWPSGQPSPEELALIQGTREHFNERFEVYPFTHRIFSDPSRPIPRNMRDLQTRSQSAVNRAIKEHGEYTTTEKYLGRAWESVSHVRLPGPLNWPVNKLFAQRDPFEVYRQQVSGGMSFSDWATPVESFVEPWMHQTVSFLKPGHVQPKLQQQRVVEQGLDLLEYVKNQRLMTRAREEGHWDLVRHYREQTLRTVTGAVLEGNQRFIRGALPRADRGFWKHFSQERDPGRRQQILQMVPGHMGLALRARWKEDIAEERAQLQGLVDSIMEKSNTNWVGWHPDFPLRAMKVRIAKQEGWDIHDFGLGYKDRWQAEELFGDYDPVDQPEISFLPDVHRHAYNTTQGMGLTGVRITGTDEPGPSRIAMTVRRDRTQLDALMAKHDSLGVTGMRY